MRVGSVDEARNVGRILVFVAGEAERGGRGRDQLNPRNVFICANFVATEAVDRSLGVGGLVTRFVRMTFNAFGRSDVGVQRRVPGRFHLGSRKSQQEGNHKDGLYGRPDCVA